MAGASPSRACSKGASPLRRPESADAQPCIARRWRGEPLAFMHIAKSGGTAFRAALLRLVPSATLGPAGTGPPTPPGYLPRHRVELDNRTSAACRAWQRACALGEGSLLSVD